MAYLNNRREIRLELKSERIKNWNNFIPEARTRCQQGRQLRNRGENYVTALSQANCRVQIERNPSSSGPGGLDLDPKMGQIAPKWDKSGTFFRLDVQKRNLV